MHPLTLPWWSAAMILSPWAWPCVLPATIPSSPLASTRHWAFPPTACPRLAFAKSAEQSSTMSSATTPSWETSHAPMETSPGLSWTGAPRMSRWSAQASPSMSQVLTPLLPRNPQPPRLKHPSGLCTLRRPLAESTWSTTCSPPSLGPHWPG